MKRAIFIISFITLCCTFGGVAFAQGFGAFGLPAVTSVEELNGKLPTRFLYKSSF
jgi:hypothetical protein